VQVQCSQCATPIRIDDAKVPDRPFKLKCPRCQAVLSLPGRAPSPPEAPAAENPAAPPAPRVQEPLGPEALAREERLREGHNDAIVALPTPVPLLEQALHKLGFNVDTAEDIEEGTRLLEQGVYEVAVTSPGFAEPGRPEALAQRILRLSPDTRRRVFVILVGDQLRTGDGTQAWTLQADLVINPADAARSENFIRSTMAEKKRLYQAFLDARRRLDAE
jgi:predicted Zn finger-like uncharacterized protein